MDSIISSASRTSTSAKDLNEQLTVVGIGASAGGLESLEHFFANLPPDSGMAFVVVQHLSPDFRSMMGELLSRHSEMPVQMAEHGEKVQANHVYLLPPGKEITIKDQQLLLSDKERSHAFTLTIDLFFRSLARDLGPKAVGIVLSGSGSDGSRGICEIKRCGGRVFVESPESAKFDGMPLSALATGTVDRAGPASELPAFLLGHAPTPAPPPADEPQESPTDAVLRLLRDHFGLDFSLYKTTTVSRRILRRVEMLGANDLAAYAKDLRSNYEELSLLYHDLLIGVTQFFRDPEAFAYLEQNVIPDLLRHVPENEEIRVWVTGCATGEEAYSLAMILYEQILATGRSLNVKILSTDVHTASLAHASAGCYQEEQLEHVSSSRRERFFVKKAGGYHVSQDLRQLIVFAPHNVTKDAPFTRMHFVSCRNMLIYLEPHAQKHVLSLLHFGLVMGGILFLGSSESPGALANEFDTIDEHSKIYRKRRDVKLLDPLQVPLTRKTPAQTRALLAQPRSPAADPQMLGVYDQLLNLYMPPSFLVNEEHQLVDTFSGAEKLFRLGGRRPSMNVLDLMEGDLRTVVAGAIQRALKSHETVRYTGVPVPEGPGWKRCGLSAQTITNPRTRTTHVLITLEDEISGDPAGRATGATEAAAEDTPATHASSERLATLESELSYTRETLQSAIEELQTSNEELQATNEELVASNEELQSTNEELHSVNEELYTVNAELQKKITELRELNSDMQHFLESTDVAILFLDANLGIRKYTPRTATVFHIEPQDVGRSIRHFSHNLKRPELLSEIEATLRDGTLVEEEVRDLDGTTYFLRILPYRQVLPIQNGGYQNRTESIEGVVLSLIDISALERARSRLAQLSAIVESSEDAILGKTLDGIITSWNRGAERLYGYTPEEVLGRHVKLLAPPEFASEIEGFLEALRRGERVDQSDTIRLRKDGKPLNVSVTISPIYDSDEKVVGASSIARDIGQLKRAQREIEEREAHIRLLLESTAEAIIGLGPDGLCTFVNPSCVRMLGYNDPGLLVGRHIHALVHFSGQVEHHSPEDCPITSVLRTGNEAHSDDEVFARADGATFLSEYWSYPIRRGSQIVGVVVTFLDITARKRSENEIRTGSRRREEFLAMLSHELRNPLAAVMSATSVLQSANPGVEATNRARMIIERQSRHMARLLDDLLDVSRITRGGIELHKEDVDLREVISTAIEATAPVLADRSEPVITNISENALAVRGDSDRLQQVLVNLISNAARYSPPDTPIWLSAVTEGDFVVIRVKDAGRGIPPHMLSDIFELFVQNEQGLERSKGGLGIGLTLVRKIVELHGGTVEAFSSGPGSGSEFVVRLPRQRGAAQKDAPERRNHTSHGKRILVVEDQDDSREMMCCLLSLKGHTVMEASDGMGAIDAIETHHPDIAFVDIGLPILNGYEVARKIRANPGLDEVVLVALTGYGRDQDILAAKQAGFDEHLAKPADNKQLEEIMAKWNGHRRNPID